MDVRRNGLRAVRRVGAVFVLAIFGFAGAALATSYTYEIFSSPFDQSVLSSLYAGNTTNQLGDTVAAQGTGFSLCAGGNCSYVAPPALPTPYPSAYYPTLLGINNRDQVAVTFGNISGPCFSYSWQNGTYTQIAGMFDPHVKGINNGGEIVGSYDNTVGGGYAYVWKGGQSSILQPGVSWNDTRPYGINDDGKVWGWGSVPTLGRMANGVWNQIFYFTATPVRAPEPYNLLLIASGLLALLGFRKSARK